MSAPGPGDAASGRAAPDASALDGVLFGAGDAAFLRRVTPVSRPLLNAG